MGEGARQLLRKSSSPALLINTLVMHSEPHPADSQSVSSRLTPVAQFSFSSGVLLGSAVAHWRHFIPAAFSMRTLQSKKRLNIRAPVLYIVGGMKVLGKCPM